MKPLTSHYSTHVASKQKYMVYMVKSIVVIVMRHQQNNIEDGSFILSGIKSYVQIDWAFKCVFITFY